MITKQTANFLIDIVRNSIADAEVYVSEGEDTDGVYSDKLVQLVQAEKELLDILSQVRYNTFLRSEDENIFNTDYKRI